MAKRLPLHGYGTCAVCGGRFGARLPRARFLPGDGTELLPFKHKVDGKRCEGSYMATVETTFERW